MTVPANILDGLKLTMVRVNRVWRYSATLLALTPWAAAKHLIFPMPLSPPVPARTGPVTDRNGATLPPFNTIFEFDQLIDHNNPSAGTFKQRFWHTYEFYEKGGY